jgi:hypothetical protein
LVKKDYSIRQHYNNEYKSGPKLPMPSNGGWRKGGSEKLGDMWKWDGAQWTEIKLTGKTPGKKRRARNGV